MSDPREEAQLYSPEMDKRFYEAVEALVSIAESLRKIEEHLEANRETEGS